MSKLFALVAAASVVGAQAVTCPLTAAQASALAAGTFNGQAACGAAELAKVAGINTADQGLAVYNASVNGTVTSVAVYTKMLYCTFGVAYLTKLNRCAAAGCSANLTALCGTLDNSTVVGNLLNNIPAASVCNQTCASLFPAALSGADYSLANVTTAPTSAASSVEAGLLAGVSILAAVLSF